jgi:hypothetical protein
LARLPALSALPAPIAQPNALNARIAQAAHHARSTTRSTDNICASHGR